VEKLNNASGLQIFAAKSGASEQQQRQAINWYVPSLSGNSFISTTLMDLKTWKKKQYTIFD
jgi:hypothetical protein